QAVQRGVLLSWVIVEEAYDIDPQPPRMQLLDQLQARCTRAINQYRLAFTALPVWQKDFPEQARAELNSRGGQEAEHPVDDIDGAWKRGSHDLCGNRTAQEGRAEIGQSDLAQIH